MENPPWLGESIVNISFIFWRTPNQQIMLWGDLLYKQIQAVAPTDVSDPRHWDYCHFVHLLTEVAPACSNIDRHCQRGQSPTLKIAQDQLGLCPAWCESRSSSGTLPLFLGVRSVFPSNTKCWRVLGWFNHLKKTDISGLWFLIGLPTGTHPKHDVSTDPTGANQLITRDSGFKSAFSCGPCVARALAAGGILAGGVLWDLCVPHKAATARGDTKRISVLNSYPWYIVI